MPERIVIRGERKRPSCMRGCNVAANPQASIDERTQRQGRAG